MHILNYLKTPIEYLRNPDARRQAVEKEMLALVKAVQTRAIQSRRWVVTVEVENAQSDLGVLFDSVICGHSTLEDFEKAVKRWESLGSK